MDKLEIKNAASLGPLDSALMLAIAAHSGQVDKAGKPYILHPLRVMMAMHSDEERIAAVLHDVAEDCGIGIAAIEEEFGPVIGRAIEALSRRANEPYMGFIGRLAANALARKVKMADLADNMDLSRLAHAPAPNDIIRQAKYAAALEFLERAE